MIINQFGGGSAAEKVLKTEIFTQSGTWSGEGVRQAVRRRWRRCERLSARRRRWWRSHGLF